MKREKPANRYYFVTRVSLVFFSLFFAGCHQRVEDKWTRMRPAVYPATGIVEYAGQPVDAAMVTFISGRDDGTDAEAQMAFGRTDAAGRFRLRRYREYEGAVAGDYRVTVSKVVYQDATPPNGDPERDYPPIEKSVLPARYRTPDTSGLTATVTPEGPNSFRFILE